MPADSSASGHSKENGSACFLSTAQTSVVYGTCFWHRGNAVLSCTRCEGGFSVWRDRHVCKVQVRAFWNTGGAVVGRRKKRALGGGGDWVAKNRFAYSTLSSASRTAHVDPPPWRTVRCCPVDVAYLSTSAGLHVRRVNPAERVHHRR